MSSRNAYQGLKRPLPPPQSREDVITEINSAGPWEPLDNSGDTQICIRHKRLRVHEEIPRHTRRGPFPDMEPDFPDELASFANDLQARLCAKPAGDDRPKKNLFSYYRASPQSVRANKLERCSTIEEDPADKNTSTEYQGHDTRGDSTDQGALEDSQDDARKEALELARISHWSFNNINSFGNADDPNRAESPCREAKNLAREKLEKAGQERSRCLREQALARRAEQQSTPRTLSPEISLVDGRRNVTGNADTTVDTGSTHKAQRHVQLEIPDRRSPSQRRPGSPDIGRLFDIAREAERDDHGHSSKTNRAQKSTVPAISSNGLHPASRAAAEQYRTQNRHLVASSEGESEGSSLQQLRNLEEAEMRLRRLTSINPKLYSTPKSQFLGFSTSKIERANEARKPDTENSTTGSRSSISSTAARMHTDVLQSKANPINLTRLLPIRSLSPANKQDRISHGEAHASRRALATEHIVSYPPQGELIKKPKDFENWSRDRQAIVIKHEIQKERLRDLEAIIPTFEQIARFSALEQASSRERTEISSAQEFVKAVIDQDLSGKRMRKRFLEVQANMKRRVQKRASKEEPQYEDILDGLLERERRERIKQMIADVQVDVEMLSVMRYEANQKRYAKKRDRPGNDVRSTEARKELSLTERKRTAQYAASDRKADVIRAKLALFKHPDDPLLDQRPVANASQYESDSASVTSEEEDGAEFQSRPDPLLLKKSFISSDDDAAPIRDDEVQSRKQGSDAALAVTMHRKDHQRSILVEQSSQRPNPDLVSTANERTAQQEIDSEFPADGEAVAEFDNLDSGGNCEDTDKDDDDDDDDEERICYRYTVKSMYSGIPGYEDGVEYVGEHYLHLTAARKALETLNDHIRSVYSGAKGRDDIPALSTYDERDERYDMTVDFEGDERALLRIWIEKEEYSPSKQAYADARIKRACHAKPFYTVLWEKTVTPIIDREDATDGHPDDRTSKTGDDRAGVEQSPHDVDHIDHDGDNDDNLFGPDTSLPVHPTKAAAPGTPAPPEGTTSRIAFDALRCFTNIAQANRHAKDVFMQWFMDHLHGKANHRYILNEDRLLEEQLESYGNRTTWEREDEFDVFENSGDQEHGSSSTGYNDRFKVWVVEKELIGPAN